MRGNGRRRIWHWLRLAGGTGRTPRCTAGAAGVGQCLSEPGAGVGVTGAAQACRLDALGYAVELCATGLRGTSPERGARIDVAEDAVERVDCAARHGGRHTGSIRYLLAEANAGSGVARGALSGALGARSEAANRHTGRTRGFATERCARRRVAVGAGLGVRSGAQQRTDVDTRRVGRGLAKVYAGGEIAIHASLGVGGDVSSTSAGDLQADGAGAFGTEPGAGKHIAVVHCIP